MDKTNISYNEDGFPIDEKGNFIQILDANGNCVVFVGRREYDYDEENRFCYCRPIGSNEYDKKIIFSRTDQLQVKKAIKEIAYVLMGGFTGELESELLPLNPRVNPAKYPTIEIYINEVDSFLNYLGSVYGINFEYSTYIEYKEITRNQLIAAKTKLYNDRAIEKSVSFIENWFSGKDKIYLQKLELINKLEKETPKETEPQQTPDVKEQPENPHPRIFKESIHFQLFDYLRRNIDKNQLAEFSFIYWQMIKDGFIYEGVKPTEYKNWLSVTYQIDLIELKQYHNCNTGNKLTLYQTAKRLFQC